jgi:hypothetical protein
MTKSSFKQSEPQGNYSVAGEEDPGASPGSVHAGVQDQARVELTNAELVQLQLRVIALENLVTALLAHAPPQAQELARALAANISPRCGSTQHHLTVRAASQMIHLLERAQVSREALRLGDSTS